MNRVNKELIEKRKVQLEAEEKRLEGEIASLRNYPDIDYGYTEDDNALEVELFNNNLGLVRSLDQSLRNVKAALERIENGAFGVCDLCGGAIEPERLEISPESPYCVACASKSKK